MNFTESSQRAIRAEALRRKNFVTLRAAAGILGVDVRTLRRWHDQGIGPKRQELVRKRPIFYLRADVEEFAARKLAAVQSPATGHSEADHKPTTANGHFEKD
jgi:hypothetical protein